LLINKVRRLGENPNPLIANFLRHIVFFSQITSRVFPPNTFFPMVDAGGVNLDAGVQMEKRGRSHPRGSKNKRKDVAVVASPSTSMKQRPGRPVGSKNKPKVSAAAPGPSAAPRNASPPAPPKIYSFFLSASPTLNASRYNVCR
jgi:hypothetical protein